MSHQSKRAGDAHAFRDFLTVGLFATSLLCALFFAGVGIDLWRLGVTASCVVVALMLRGPEAWLAVARRNPLPLVFAVWLLVAIAFSHWRGISPDSSFAPSWLAALAVLWFLAGLHLRHPWWLMAGGVCVTGFFACLSAVRFLWLDTRPAYPQQDPNVYAAILYLCWIPLAHETIAGRLGKSPGPRVLLALVHSVFLLSIFATAGRAAAGIVVLTFAGWAVFLVRARASWWHYSGLVALAMVAYATFALRAPDLLQGMTGAAPGVDPEAIRLSILDAAWRAVGEHGVLGTGLYTFSLLYPGYRSVVDQSTTGLFVHNDYLQILLEGGVFLFVPFVLILVLVIVRLCTALWRGGAELWARSTGALAALAAVYVQAIVYFPFYKAPVVVLAGGLAAFAFSQPWTPPREGGSRKPWVVWGVVASAGTYAWAMLALEVFNYSVFARQGEWEWADRLRGTPERLLTLSRASQRLNAARGVPVLTEAAVLAALKADPVRGVHVRHQLVLNTFRRAIAVDAWNAHAYMALHDYIVTHGVPQETLEPGERGDALLERALDLNPRDLTVIAAYLDHLDRTGRIPTAHDVAKTRVVPWLRSLFYLDARATRTLLDGIEARASALGDDPFVTDLQTRWARLLQLMPPAARSAYDAWLSER